MKKLLLFIVLAITTIIGYSQAADYCFRHTATTGNISANWTTIDHPMLNGVSDAQIFVTHNLNADGSTTYSDENIGVNYASGSWVIYNEDVSPMMDSTSYNVYIAGTEANVITYTTTGGNYYELIDHPFLNDNPNAKIVITNDYNTSYNPGTFGVYYSATNKWGIFNEDGATPIPAGFTFNVLLEPALLPHLPTMSYTHESTTGNIIGNYTEIDHPLLNNNPDANFVATHNLSGNAVNVWFDHPIGVWYKTGTNRWTIFTEDTFTFVADVTFNIAIAMPVPSNDESSGAIPLALEPFGTGCSSPVTISNLGATDSSPINGVPTCGSFSGGDIWYYFTAPPSGEVKLFRTVTGNWGALSYGVYLNPSSTSALVCDWIPENQTDFHPIEGLTPGTQYGLRIWEWNNNDFGTEEICLREWVSGAGIADAVIDGFSMYPNPVKDILNLSTANTIDVLNVYNMLGQEVLQSVPSTNQVELDMSSLPSGAYIIKVQAGEQIGSYNLIKE